KSRPDTGAPRAPRKARAMDHASPFPFQRQMSAHRPAPTLNPSPDGGGRAGMGASPSRRSLRVTIALLAGLVLASTAPQADARTVYRCVRDGTVSLSTAPEPGSKCEAKELDDNAVQTPNLWGSMGVFSGTLYEREQDGTLVYSTRNLPGSRVYLRFTAVTPPGEPAHEGLGRVGTPRLA